MIARVERSAATVVRSGLFAARLILVSRLAFAAVPAEVQPNDNRHPAGHLASGVLTLRLEVRGGVWNPEGENGPEIPVQAFAEEGRPLVNPGPLIRIPAGTRIRIFARNLLPSQPVTLHGLHSHTAAKSTPVTVPPGGVREFEFRAVRPGAYFYWGS